MRLAVLLSVLLGVAAQARADRVHLDDGAVLDGEAEVGETQVTVHAPGGSVTLPREAVVQIERAETVITRFDRRYAKLGPKDVAGRLRLADFCHDNGLSGQEERLLREIIELVPDHPLARMNNVTLSAHAAFRTLEASMTLLRRAIDIVRKIVAK